MTNPYGRSKLMNEEILRDLFVSDARWHISLLRYFNPVGAHESGMIGEDPNGVPNNLMPYLAQVAAGKLSVLSVYGNDWPTPDGTGVLEMIAAFARVTGQSVPYKIVERRVGDIATCYANTALAKAELGWEATRGLDEMCRDLWCWQQYCAKGV